MIFLKHFWSSFIGFYYLCNIFEGFNFFLSCVGVLCIIWAAKVGIGGQLFWGVNSFPLGWQARGFSKHLFFFSFCIFSICFSFLCTVHYFLYIFWLFCACIGTLAGSLALCHVRLSCVMFCPFHCKIFFNFHKSHIIHVFIKSYHFPPQLTIFHQFIFPPAILWYVLFVFEGFSCTCITMVFSFLHLHAFQLFIVRSFSY